MNYKRITRLALLKCGACAALLLGPALLAFPPAPHHLIFGLCRDEMGDPLLLENAEVVFETSSGVQLNTAILPHLDPGVNYQLAVPMDAGVTADAYKPTALQPTVPFRIRVRVGSATYLPIEMSGNYSQLGQPAGRTRLNLTLGEDSDGDGLPDAWERALIALTGGTNTLAGIRPGDDLDRDGLSNLQEYYAGTYAFDPDDGFALNRLTIGANNAATLEFMVVRGRTYTVQSSADLIQWQSVQFRVTGPGPGAPLIWSYGSTDVRVLRVVVEPQPGEPAHKYFRLILE